MDNIEFFLRSVSNVLWGPPLLAFILGTGIYLTIRLRGLQFRYLGYAFKQVFAGQRKNSLGDINPFEALMTSLAGAIGTGNIVGVATAVMIGGMGSLFWMSVTAFVSMATKYAESLLAVKYRVLDDRGEMCGGPMQYIERGLGHRWLAYLFALFGSLAAIGTGNLVQVNAISEATRSMIAMDPLWIGFITAGIVGVVIIGGVRSIGHVAGVLVPLMATFYVAGGVVILAMNYAAIPSAVWLILKSAFTGQAALGGFTGATVMMALQMGVARSIFSNEAGLGISSIAAAAAKTDMPARQAMITMTGALFSTVIVCTFTGLVLAVTHVVGSVTESGTVLSGASLAIEAFGTGLIGGRYVVTVGLILFAASTIFAWAYYGEKCCEYLFGTRSVIPYRVVYCLIVIPGAVLKMEIVWLIADIFNALMVIPNLIAVLALTGVILSESRTFIEMIKREESEAHDVIASHERSVP